MSAKFLAGSSVVDKAGHRAYEITKMMKSPSSSPERNDAGLYGPSWRLVTWQKEMEADNGGGAGRGQRRKREAGSDSGRQYGQALHSFLPQRAFVLNRQGTEHSGKRKKKR